MSAERMSAQYFGIKNGKRKAFCFLSAMTMAWWIVHSSLAAAHDLSYEAIDLFSTELLVRRDGVLEVKELIDYHFGEEEHHGIYRDIPVRYTTESGNTQSLRIEVTEVSDGSGTPQSYTVGRKGDMVRIKIGDPDTLIRGERLYAIRYTVRYAFGYFDDFDEMYWNATGNGWDVPIEKAFVKVTLPSNTLSPEGFREACYFGPLGSTERCDAKGSLIQNIYAASSPRTLSPGEGLTVAIGFPKGLIAEPEPYEQWGLFIKDNPVVFLPLAVLAGMSALWYRRGRDPKGKGVIIPEYDVPESLSSLEMAGLAEGKVTTKDISAAIVELAVLGYLTIRKTENKGLVFTKEEYAFERSRQPSRSKLKQSVLTALFGGADEFGKSVKLSDLKNAFYKFIPTIEREALEHLVAKGLYVQNPKSVMGRYIVIGSVVCFIAFFFFSVVGAATITSLVLSAIIYFGFAVLMPRVTKRGALVKERLFGLKEYLQIAEKNRLDFHNAPEKKPEAFERLLPAAMILGVEQAWAKEFADMYDKPPQWYSGPPGSSFSTAGFASTLGDFGRLAASTLASAPGGSGGGGSSGGGGGGGGGGSW